MIMLENNCSLFIISAEFESGIDMRYTIFKKHWENIFFKANYYNIIPM